MRNPRPTNRETFQKKKNNYFFHCKFPFVKKRIWIKNKTMENTQTQPVSLRSFYEHVKVQMYVTTREEDIRRIATTIGIDQSQYTKMELIEKLMKYKRSE